MSAYWSDSRCTGIAVSIGQMLLDPPKLGTPDSIATVLGVAGAPLPGPRAPRKQTREEKNMRRRNLNAERVRRFRLEIAVRDDFDRLQKADELAEGGE